MDNNKRKIILGEPNVNADEITKHKRPEALQKISESSDFDVPDGGYGWVIVAISFLATTVVDGVINSFGVFLSDLMKEFDVSGGQIAWVGSILAGTPLLIGPVASTMTTKYGCRITCITGSLMTSLALGVSIFCPTVTLLMATYFVAGIGLGLILLPACILVGYYFDSKRALATGIALSGSGLGTTIFPPVVNYILGISNWKVANLCLATCALCCAIFGALMRPLKPKTVLSKFENYIPIKSELTKNEESKSTIDVSFSNMAEYMLYKQRNNQKVKGENLGDLRNRSQSNVIDYYAFKRRNSIFTRKEIFYAASLMQLNIPKKRNTENSSDDNLRSTIKLGLLKDRKFMLFGLVNIFAMMSFYIPLMYIVEYAKSNFIEARLASFLISVIGIINTVARIGFGYIVTFPMIDSIFVNNICLLIGAIAVALLPYCQNYVSYIFASLFFGVSIASYSSLTPIILVDLLGLEQLTNAFGVIQLFRGVTALLGTPMAGALLDWTHSYSVPFFVAGGLFLLSTVFGFILQYLHLHQKPINNDNLKMQYI